MKVSIIVAVGLKGEIGLKGKLPWRLAADLRNFKRLTMGHCLLMGRVTWESLGKSLPGRKLMVLSRSEGIKVPDGTVVKTFEDAVKLAQDGGDDELFIAGGAQLYEVALPFCDRIYISKVFYAGAADTYFPEVDWARWQRTLSVYHPDDGAEPAWQFEVWEKRTDTL